VKPRRNVSARGCHEAIVILHGAKANRIAEGCVRYEAGECRNGVWRPLDGGLACADGVVVDKPLSRPSLTDLHPHPRGALLTGSRLLEEDGVDRPPTVGAREPGNAPHRASHVARPSKPEAADPGVGRDHIRQGGEPAVTEERAAARQGQYSWHADLLIIPGDRRWFSGLDLRCGRVRVVTVGGDYRSNAI
jgi:hypothetical protein